MFNTLTEKLNSAFHVLKGHGKITEINVAETLKEVRRALLDADVSFKIAKEFTQRVKEKSLGKNVLTDLRPGQLMVKIVKDELTELMGGEHEGVNLSENPLVDWDVANSGNRSAETYSLYYRINGTSDNTIVTGITDTEYTIPYSAITDNTYVFSIKALSHGKKEGSNKCNSARNSRTDCTDRSCQDCYHVQWRSSYC